MYLLWERNDSGKMLEYLIWWGGSVQTASLSVLCWDLTQQNDILGCIPISGAGNDSWSWCWFAGWWVLQGRRAGCSVSLLAAGVGNNSLVKKKTQISLRLWEGSGGSDCSVSSECHRVCVLSGFSPGFELGVLNTQLMWGSASPCFCAFPAMLTLFSALQRWQHPSVVPNATEWMSVFLLCLGVINESINKTGSFCDEICWKRPANGSELPHLQ